jgi:hypothetical protein
MLNSESEPFIPVNMGLAAYAHLRMLFEFHRQQNGKKPGSVHATYLIAGSKPRPQVLLRKDGEDEYMHSSPLRSSPVPHPEDSAENIRTMSITLAQEEDLDGEFGIFNIQWEGF